MNQAKEQLGLQLTPKRSGGSSALRSFCMNFVNVKTPANKATHTLYSQAIDDDIIEIVLVKQP
mgnify:CR=1 FL=1|tara:strand:+ start:249 stop:437 length:189 start_codon:yes stop_codon:yes gene_type:complete